MNQFLELGNKIKALREKKGVKQSDLAKEIEIAPSYLSRMERGELRISPAKLQRIANFFNISIEELAAFQSLETQMQNLDPSINLRRALQEKEDQILRIRENVESFLLKNLNEFKWMETQLHGPKGATKRAEERLFNWKALSNLLDRNSTSPDFFLTDLYAEFSIRQQEETLQQKTSMKISRATGSTKSKS